MAAATKVTSPGRRTSAAAVPDSWPGILVEVAAEQRDGDGREGAQRGRIQAENERRPKAMGLARSAATSTRASAPATTAATRRPVLERVECASASPTGPPARDATTAPAGVPEPADGRADHGDCRGLGPREEGELPAPGADHVSRRRAASVSRRMLTAARIANAKRSAADSPPTSRSLRPATSLDSDALWRSASGAVGGEGRVLERRTGLCLVLGEAVDVPCAYVAGTGRTTSRRSCDTRSRARASRRGPRRPRRGRGAAAPAGDSRSRRGRGAEERAGPRGLGRSNRVAEEDRRKAVRRAVPTSTSRRPSRWEGSRHLAVAPPRSALAQRVRGEAS